MRTRSVVLACVLAASFASIAHAQSRVFVEKPGLLEFSGTLIVRPVQGLDPDRAAAARALLADSVVRYYPEVDEYVIGVDPAMPPNQRADVRSLPGTAFNGPNRGTGENAVSQRLMASGLFQYAVPNWICYPLDTTPNDPLFPNQWHHAAMHSPAGWDVSTGSSSITVAVTDTGIDLTHPDLAPKRVPGFDAYNRVAEADGGSVADLHGHGTHVSGCATAMGNNGVGVSGVNWNAKIMMIRVAIDSSGGAYYEDLMFGARWAIEHGAKTVSASYSGIDYDPIQTTGEYIKSIGGLYFYAAGNDSRDLSWFDFPDVVIVGASEYSDQRAYFSAYGHAVDVFAPGYDILSTCYGGGYCSASGTSMATPVANGVASLIWSINPSLTPNQVEQILFTSCQDLGAPGNDDFFGWGRVDVKNAALAAAATLYCPSDFDHDHFVTGDDFDAYVTAFELGSISSDFDHDGFVTGDDFDAYVAAFEAGC